MEEKVELQDSFWFNREEDEIFKGNLSNRRIKDTNRASKAYAEFLATSTRLSLVSFTPHASTVLNTKIPSKQLEATFIAAEMLPEIQEPPTWKQWVVGRKLLILASVVAAVGILLVSFYTVPVTELNNDQTLCSIFLSEVARIECSASIGEGYCIQHTVAVPLSDGLFESSVLQGFEVFTDLDNNERVNCALTNCTSDPFTDLEVEIESLSDACLASLEEQNVTADEVDDVSLVACSLLAQEEACVRVLESDSVFKRNYFDVTFENGVAVTVPKQPSSETVTTITTVFFVFFAILVIAAVIESRKPVVPRPTDAETNQNLEVKAIVQDK